MPAGRDAFFEALRPVLALPVPALNDLFAALRGSNLTLVLGYLGVIVPMGLFNLVGSLQNIESAEAAGDRFRGLASAQAALELLGRDEYAHGVFA
ncbi:MAG: hypothetical protein IIB19_04455 [Chloroflexi bacterium]|nr:hypothetical protein [Chloroflexota bacterium]